MENFSFWEWFFENWVAILAFGVAVLSAIYTKRQAISADKSASEAEKSNNRLDDIDSEKLLPKLSIGAVYSNQAVRYTIWNRGGSLAHDVNILTPSRTIKINNIAVNDHRVVDNVLGMTGSLVYDSFLPHVKKHTIPLQDVPRHREEFPYNLIGKIQR